MKKALFVFFLSFVVLSVFAQGDKDSQVWTKVEALNKAVFETKDSATIAELVADSATYGHSTGVLENKLVMLHNAVNSAESYKNISLEPLSTTTAGPSVIIRYILRADVSKGDEKYPLNIAILQVWSKDKGKWKLYARQAVKVAPKS